MEHGGKLAAGMHGHVHGKIPERHLLADRAQRPLVRQQD
jgi:hypothetical protein